MIVRERNFRSKCFSWFVLIQKYRPRVACLMAGLLSRQSHFSHHRRIAD